MFCASAAWSPDTIAPNQPQWQLDFPLNPIDGAVIPDIFDRVWINNYDATTLIQNPTMYTDSLNIYFDTRPGDGNKPFNDTFHIELLDIQHPHIYNVFPSGGHQYSNDQAENGFMFLDSVMDAMDPFSPA